MRDGKAPMPVVGQGRDVCPFPGWSWTIPQQAGPAHGRHGSDTGAEKNTNGQKPSSAHGAALRLSRWASAASESGHGQWNHACLLYTSDAADDLLCVDLGGRRIIKKTKTSL